MDVPGKIILRDTRQVYDNVHCKKQIFNVYIYIYIYIHINTFYIIETYCSNT